MKLVDRIRTLAIAVSATAMVTCSTGQVEPRQAEPVQQMLEQEVTAGQEVVEAPTIEGEVLDYAVRHSFYHEGRIVMVYQDLLAQEPGISNHDYEVQFFLTTTRDQDGSAYVGVIHLRDESHEIDVMVYESRGFPSVAPGDTRNGVHYHEFGSPHYRLQLVTEREESFIRGGPEHLDQDSLAEMYIQFFRMYNATMYELRVQNEIMDDYRASQVE